MSLPGPTIHNLGGDVINLATSTPVNGCDLRRVSWRTRLTPKSREPAAALSTMTGALSRGIVKNWVADQNSAGR
jgi:hypothetical protein